MRPEVLALLLTASCAAPALPPSGSAPSPPSPRAPLPLSELHATGALRAELRHPSWVTKVAFSSDGTRLATGDDSGLVRIWDPASGGSLGELPVQAGRITALAFKPASHELAVGAGTGLATFDAVPDRCPWCSRYRPLLRKGRCRECKGRGVVRVPAEASRAASAGAARLAPRCGCSQARTRAPRQRRGAPSRTIRGPALAAGGRSG